MFKIGDVVTVAENASVLDCCAGKRGRIVHTHVQGGWLLTTDHFCPIARQDDELTIVPIEVLAGEVFKGAHEYVRKSYMEADTETLREYATRHRDKKAWAALVLRGEWEEDTE